MRRGSIPQASRSYFDRPVAARGPAVALRRAGLHARAQVDVSRGGPLAPAMDPVEGAVAPAGTTFDTGR